MGKVSEYEGLAGKEIKDGAVVLMDTAVNSATSIKLCAVPFSYTVMLGDTIMCSCNQLENALMIYQIMQADMRCEVWQNGNESKA